MEVPVKQEILEVRRDRENDAVSRPLALIELSSSGDSDSDSDSEEETNDKKKRKLNDVGVVLPVGFLAPLSTASLSQPLIETESKGDGVVCLTGQSCKQFWKAGDYEGAPHGDWNVSSGGMDHVRVHPKFLHSNATSHKWALGAFAELLDNALDEVCNGATYVNIDMLENRKDRSRMLLIEDNGGGMNPDKMRHCMSLGYSVKSKMANTIGQYGNGFKTSTMRLGADVIVFSRCRGEDGKSPTQSIGLLSYTFLRSTGKEDIVVPMLDYQKDGHSWNKMIRSSPTDWDKNVETIVEWAPFSSEADLLRQFNEMSDHGTRIIIYNLWEDDEGLLELDFDADPHDIQLRGVNRDEKNIQMAKRFPNSRHFLTYRHSLRSYASILYLRIPPCFRVILRGKDVEHHNIVNDMMMSREMTYRPQTVGDGIPKESHMAAIVTIGFVKDAKHHIDVQGFNVYHKNRLIKPFWRLWNAAGSDGRGVIGVLEANFVEPAHDKQGFERTTVLSRLEAKLVQMQKNYWNSLCHKIGYAPRRNKKQIDPTERETSPDRPKRKNTDSSYKASPSFSDNYNLRSNGTTPSKGNLWSNGKTPSKGNHRSKSSSKLEKISKFSEPSSPPAEDASDDDLYVHPIGGSNGKAQKTAAKNGLQGNHAARSTKKSPSKVVDVDEHSRSVIINRLQQENRELKKRLEKGGADFRDKESNCLQCENCQSLELQLGEARKKIDELSREQDSLVDIFSEERVRRDNEEQTLRKRLEDASNTIQELRDKIQLLEKKPSRASR